MCIRDSAWAASPMLSKEDSLVKDWSLNSGKASPAARWISCRARRLTMYFSSPATTNRPESSLAAICFFRPASSTTRCV